MDSLLIYPSLTSSIIIDTFRQIVRRRNASDRQGLLRYRSILYVWKVRSRARARFPRQKCPNVVRRLLAIVVPILKVVDLCRRYAGYRDQSTCILFALLQRALEGIAPRISILLSLLHVVLLRFNPASPRSSDPISHRSL